MTFAVFHDYPGLEYGLPKFMTFQAQWSPCLEILQFTPQCFNIITDPVPQAHYQRYSPEYHRLLASLR